MTRYHNAVQKKILQLYPSQEAFSFAVKDRAACVSRIANGWQKIDERRAKTWSKFLGVTVEELHDLLRTHERFSGNGEPVTNIREEGDDHAS